MINVMLNELTTLMASRKNWGKMLNNHKTTKYDILKAWILEQTPYLPDGCSITQRVWHITNSTTLPMCKQCGENTVTWSSKKISYNDFCSYKCSANSKSTRQKAFNTNLKRYGAGDVLQSKEIREKIKTTNIKRYGADTPLANKSIRERIKATNREIYGGNSPMSSEVIKNKIKRTNIERFGTEWFLSSNDAIKSRTQHFRHNYGVDNNMQIHLGSDALNFLNDKDWLTIQHHYNKMPLCHIGKMLGVSTTSISDYFKKHDIGVKLYYQSSAELELGTLLTEHGINYSIRNRNIISGELDIFIPSHNLAIEYNGLFWHSERNIDNTIHKRKYDECHSKDIRLLTIFENEWVYRKEVVSKKLLNILKLDKNVGTTIYARKTQIEDIGYIEKKKFFNANHIQGDGPSSINYGLIHNDELVACIGFIKQKDHYVLNRYATSCNVPGGFTRLLKHFEREYNTPKIVTFADLRWSEGDLYKNTGFTLDKELPPDYYWCKGNKLWHKFNWRHTSGLKKLLNYDPNKTEVENMHAHGFYRIWDCGKLRFTKN